MSRPLLGLLIVTALSLLFAVATTSRALAGGCALNPNGNTLVITCYGVPSPAPQPTTLPTMRPGVLVNSYSYTFYGSSGSNGRNGFVGIPSTSGGGGSASNPLVLSLGTTTSYYTNPFPTATVPPGTLLYVNGGSSQNARAGVLLQSIGGSGGTGGNGYLGSSGSSGGQGGAGASINAIIGVNGSLPILTTVADTPGIWVRSAGGTGGNGGSGYVGGNGADGAPGGSGGLITLNVGANVYTLGDYSAGILAQSVGGNGGNGGSSTWTIGGSGGNGAGGQSGSNVTVNLSSGGTILTSGIESDGILAQSIGGFGGAGGGAGGLLITFGGGGSSGGLGGAVTVFTQGSTLIQTTGADSDGILAESVGGAGGTGGSAGAIFASAGNAGGGGTGSSVLVNNSANIYTNGSLSKGIFAQSVGGFGGDGGGSGGLVSLGGAPGAGSSGGSVTVYNYGNIATYSTGNGIGDASSLGSAAIFAQSVGGGGGNGGEANGWVSVGGVGGGGGSGGNVFLVNYGNLATSANFSQGILEQSIGGGGGNGGSAGAFGIGGSLGIGGKGGNGGNGGNVSLTAGGGNIATLGDFSQGIEMQSVGGGGGNGGNAISVSAGPVASISIGLGGSGGSGGYGGSVGIGTGFSSASPATIVTSGFEADGLLVQSVGGGGGNGGESITASVAPTAAIAIALGGSGGGGGAGGSVVAGTPNTPGRNNALLYSVTTSGVDADGILAQSVGGGGGNGGITIGAAASKIGSLSLALGSRGGAGGAGGNVQLNSSGTIQTSGANATGILVQSVGGGGGNGGDAVAGSLGSISGGLALGGGGGAGQNAGAAWLINSGNVTTTGVNADALIAQSVGGGGGNGGFSVAGTIGVSFAAAVGIGGGAGSGGTGDLVTLTSTGKLSTMGDLSDAILAQSIGGGGGNGGFSVAGTLSSGPVGSVSVGGSGGNGGVASAVYVTQSGIITTGGNESSGIAAESIGGGGGNGGFSVGGAISSGAPGLAFSLGGSGGTGAEANNVVVAENSGSITTQGANANDILAESIGGGGGNGGFSVAGGITSGGTVSVGVGGDGGNGGNGASVSVTTGATTLQTGGEESDAILAQSIGGGGGNGGFAVAGSLSSSSKVAVNVAVGGDGGSGAGANTVTVSSQSTVVTYGDESTGIAAQSIGGGGGNGGFSVSGSLAAGGPNTSIAVAVGGQGGAGGNGYGVSVTSTGQQILTSGFESYGILAQSIGGGGGNGGFVVSGQVATTPSTGYSSGTNVTVGGQGGGGGNSDVVMVTNGANIITKGVDADGVLAQSIGGGGGNGGWSVTATYARGTTNSVALGGKGGSGGSAGNVTLSDTANIQTFGENASAIEAQSIGGGGGNGGFVVNASAAVAPPGQVQNNASVTAAFGGSGGTGSGAGTVGVTAGSATATTSVGLITNSDNANGILAQSIGGGGGNGGFAVTFQAQAGTSPPANDPTWSATLAFGGNAGSGGSGNTVSVSNFDSIRTNGTDSAAIDAQSIGGGGGNGGFAVNASLNTTGNTIAVAFGGNGGAGNTGNTVTVNSGTSGGSTMIETLGDSSQGILAQSIGGGGGNGGFSVAAAAGTTNSLFSGSPNAGLALGSAGGGGADANTVTVTNYSAISTSGGESAGIEAQSIGGGGGSAGFKVNAKVTPSGGGGGFKYGSGGDASNGGTVNLTNNGTIETQGDQSDGILAQSVGGGGGFGGASETTTFGQPIANAIKGLDLDMGSTAGGGNGAMVSVTNTGSIMTSGAQSAAIEAQSVGGGGGEGGMAVGGSISISQDPVAFPGMQFGSSGGAGGSGGAVSVTNTAAMLETTGVESDGILAQSVGGGGGNGGLAVSGSVTQSITGGVAMGGYGGSGGSGNNVSVQSTNTNGAIVTQGDLSIGIMAESIGNGGGSGGDAVRGQATSSLGINVALGASGGSGGSGGQISLTDNGQIQTQGNVADGILAQSIGGGGGNAGYAVSGTLSPAVSGTGAYGMSGGLGGSGGTVGVTQTGSMFTDGIESNAIVAESIGGGGGNGGFTVAGAAGFGGLGLAFGASGGAGGSSGAVTVTTSAAIIETNGALANGIIAQSIGGGGGNAGANYSGVAGYVPVGIFLGASGGSGGNGNTVNVTNSGGIATEGQLANGIVAQSIGGGGGYFTDTQTVRSMLGASNNASGGANTVNVTNNAGATIETTGDSSFGIFAQSIGGGGGAIAAPTTATLKSGSGSGSAVTIVNNGSIETTGVASDGIFAQSVGGGGGYAGAAGTFFAGSGGGTGSASLVSVMFGQGAQDITTGANAVGIYAQSASGSGSVGGRVTVNVGGLVDALNASAIVESSTGRSGGGALNMVVRPTGSVISGAAGPSTNPSTAPSAAAINFVAGMNATLTNNGLVEDTNGYAVVSNTASTTITNNGSMAGSVWLAPGGTNTFTNNGTFEAGPVVNLGGTNNTLTNNGTLAIGFLNNGGETTINGNLTQGSSGTLLEAVNIGAPDPPELLVTGNAALQGTLAIASVGLGSAQPGTHTFTLIDADGTLSDSMTLSTAPSAIVHYTLDPGPNGTVMLQSHVDFDPAGLTPEGLEVGSYLNAVQTAGSSPSLQGMIAQAISSANTSQLERIYDEVTPESFGAVEAATLTNALSFSQQMTACRATEATFASTAGNRCVWGTIGNTSTSQMESGAILGYNESATGVNLGTESAISSDKRTLFGAGLNFTNDNLYVNSTTMTGWRYMAGAFLKREAGTGFVYSAQLTGGVSSYQSNRWITFPSQSISDADGATGYGTIATPDTQAFSTQHVSFLSGGLRSEKRLQLRGGWTLTPYLALNDTRMYMSPMSESGAGGLSITTQGTADSFVTLQPGLQFSGAMGSIGEQHLRLHVDLFATQFLGNNQTSVSAMLQGEPAALGMTEFNSSIDRTLWNIAPTLEVSGKHGLDFRLGGSYLFSSHLHSGTINFNVSQKVGKPPGEF